jgi:hypothetical protein
MLGEACGKQMRNDQVEIDASLLQIIFVHFCSFEGRRSPGEDCDES